LVEAKRVYITIEFFFLRTIFRTDRHSTVNVARLLGAPVQSFGGGPLQLPYDFKPNSAAPSSISNKKDDVQKTLLYTLLLECHRGLYLDLFFLTLTYHPLQG